MKNKNSLINFFKFIKYEKYHYLFALIFSFSALYFELKSIKIISSIFNENFFSLDTIHIFNTGKKLVILYIIYRIIQLSFEFLKRHLIIIASNKLQINIQKYIYDHVLKLPVDYFDNIPAGSVLSRITSDVLKIKSFFHLTFDVIIVAIIKIFVMYTIMLIIDYKLALLLLAYLPLLYLVHKVNIVYEYPLEYKLRKLENKNISFINEIMQNLEIIKSFNVEDKVYEKWNNNALEIKKNNYTAIKIFSFTSYNILSVIFLLVQITIIVYYTFSVFYNLGLISSAGMITFIFYTSSIIDELSSLIFNLPVYMSSLASAKNISELLELKKEKSKGSYRLDSLQGDIEFKNVSFSYRDDEYVLKDINFKIKENETVAFVGHTGSGKSTIMNLLIKFYDNQKGDIFIGENNIRDINSNYIRENVSIVLQDSFLFEGTISQNISNDYETSRKCLQLLGAQYIIDEKGLDYIIYANGSNLSVGEMQLISFARALSKNPKILILDEATSNIDSKTEQIIQDGINILKKNRTTLIIAHRLSTIKKADRIYVLDKGIIVEQGTHDNLVKKNGYYKKLIDSQDINKEDNY